MPPKASKNLEIFAFEGVNQAVNPFLLEKSELLKAVNITHNQIGQLSPRGGYTTFLNAPDTDAVRSLIAFTKNDGITSSLLRVSGLEIYSWDFASATWGSSVKTLTDSIVPLGAVFFSDTNKLVCGNSVDATFSYDGSSFANIAAAPLGKFFCVYQNRVITNSATNPFRVHASKIADETNWTESTSDASASKHIDVNGVVLGVVVIADKITIFHSNGIARWDLETKIEIATSALLGNAESLAMNEALLYFTNQNGVYVYSGQSQPSLMSRQIDKIIKNGSKSLDGTVAAAAFKDTLYFSIGDTTDVQGESILKALAVYSALDNQWEVYSLAHAVTSMVKVSGGGGPAANYQGDVLPAAATPAWTKTASGSPTEVVSGGILTATGTGTSTQYYSITDTGLSNSVGTTLELRTKPVTLGTPDKATSAIIEDGAYKVALRFTDIGGVGYVILDECGGRTGTVVAGSQVTDGHHTYRITLKGTTLKAYVDGILERTFPDALYKEVSANKKITWGDDDVTSATHEQDYDSVKYWNNGAFAPNDADASELAPTLILGDSAGNTYKWAPQTNLDGATVINSHFETPPLFASELKTVFDTLTIFCDGMPIEVFFSLDGGDFESLDSVGKTIEQFIFPPDTIGNYIKLRFEAANPFTLYGLILEPKGSRKGER